MPTSNGRPIIVGGKFGLPMAISTTDQSPSFLEGSPVLLANARSGIRLAVDHTRPATVWLPSYSCRTMLDGANTARTSVRFYAVDERLSTDRNGLLSSTSRGDLVILVDYFGFPTDPDLMATLMRSGVVVLHDRSQALLSESPKVTADFVLYSPRKLVGVPDGGILHARNGIEDGELAPIPPDCFRPLFAAVRTRRDFDMGGTNREWRALFSQGEARMPIGRYAMSELSASLLRHAFDYGGIARRRRTNYQTLWARLRRVAVLPELPAGVVPLGFPIVVAERDRVREHLFSRDIYPPVHWPLAGTVPEAFHESHSLAERIMTLPCDQRYAPADMEYVADCVEEALSC
jgi:dTDP-4-amino-4,6-dideoxygalactose transaminase